MQAAEKAQNVLVDQLCRAILPGAQYSWELLRAARLVILDDSICTKADTERKDVSPDAWHQRSAGEKDEAVRASFEACSALAAAKARIPQPVRAHEALRETFYVGGGFEQLSVTLLTSEYNGIIYCA